MATLPNSAMRLSDAGLDAIKRRECPPPAFDYVLTAYRDGVGIWTIGCGHTDPSIAEGTIWTREQCIAALRKDVSSAEQSVCNSVTVPLTQDQFDALVSFVFNVGVGAFQRSGLLLALNAGNYDQVPGHMRQWVTAINAQTGKRETLPGLLNRRNSEIGQWTRGASVSSASVVPEPPPTLSAKAKAAAAAAVAAVAGAGGGITAAVSNTQAQVSANGGHWNIAALVAVAIGVLCAIAAHVFVKQDPQ